MVLLDVVERMELIRSIFFPSVLVSLGMLVLAVHIFWYECTTLIRYVWMMRSAYFICWWSMADPKILGLRLVVIVIFLLGNSSPLICFFIWNFYLLLVNYSPFINFLEFLGKTIVGWSWRATWDIWSLCSFSCALFRFLQGLFNENFLVTILLGWVYYGDAMVFNGSKTMEFEN